MVVDDGGSDSSVVVMVYLDRHSGGVVNEPLGPLQCSCCCVNVLVCVEIDCSSCYSVVMITCPLTVSSRNCVHGASNADRGRVVVQCRRVGIVGFGRGGTAGTTAAREAGTAEPKLQHSENRQIPMDRHHCRHPVVVELWHEAISGRTPRLLR